jgi:hypothetical protein
MGYVRFNGRRDESSVFLESIPRLKRQRILSPIDLHLRIQLLDGSIYRETVFTLFVIYLKDGKQLRTTPMYCIMYFIYSV